MCVFCLVEGFGEIVVAHDFSLGAFVVVDGFRFVFL
jgi:hypothetical protein